MLPISVSRSRPVFGSSGRSLGSGWLSEPSGPCGPKSDGSAPVVEAAAVADQALEAESPEVADQEPEAESPEVVDHELEAIISSYDEPTAVPAAPTAGDLERPLSPGGEVDEEDIYGSSCGSSGSEKESAGARGQEADEGARGREADEGAREADDRARARDGAGVVDESGNTLARGGEDESGNTLARGGGDESAGGPEHEKEEDLFVMIGNEMEIFPNIFDMSQAERAAVMDLA